MLGIDLFLGHGSWDASVFLCEWIAIQFWGLSTSLVLVRCHIRRLHITLRLVSRTFTAWVVIKRAAVKNGGSQPKLDFKKNSLLRWFFFYANKVFVLVQYSKLWWTGVTVHVIDSRQNISNVKSHTNKITPVSRIRNLFCLYLIKGGDLYWEDVNITHC